jgi:hypothetical protein
LSALALIRLRSGRLRDPRTAEISKGVETRAPEPASQPGGA